MGMEEENGIGSGNKGDYVIQIDVRGTDAYQVTMDGSKSDAYWIVGAGDDFKIDPTRIYTFEHEDVQESFDEQLAKEDRADDAAAKLKAQEKEKMKQLLAEHGW